MRKQKTDRHVDSDDDATHVDGEYRPVLSTPQPDGDDRHFWKDCSQCNKTRLWKVQSCSCNPRANFTRRGKYQSLVEPEFYDEEARLMHEEVVGSLVAELWKQKEFQHDKASVKVSTLRSLALVFLT